MNNQKGASSVLIILLLLVFIVIGLSMLTSALVQTKMVEKQINWNKEYYDLEAKAYDKLDEILLASKDYDSLSEWENIGQQVPDILVASKNDQIRVSYSVVEADKINGKNISVVLMIEKGKQLRISEWKEWQQPFEILEMNEFEESSFFEE